MRLVEERATEKKLTMRMEVAPDIGAMEADERRIRQVIFNLLNNAIRFTKPGGTISLGARRDDGAILALVERFVELHGGTVDLVSAPGKGTRATCVFPDRKSARARLAGA